MFSHLRSLLGARGARTTGMVLASCLLATSVPGRAQTSAPLIPLHVIVLPLEVAAAAYYAEDLGLFKKAGLDVTLESLMNGGAISAAVVSGAADIGSSNPVSLEIGFDKGLPVTIIGGAAFQDAKKPTNGLLGVLASGPIHTAKDLNGKTIAISGLGNTIDLGTRNWIDQHGGDSSTVKFVESSMPAMAAGVLAGRLDSAGLDASTLNAAPKGELRTVGSALDSFGPMWVQSTWFTSRAYAAAHPDIVRRYMAAIRSAGEWANAHPAEAIVMFAHHTKYTVTELQGSVRPPFITKPITPAQLQTTIDVATKYGFVKTKFSGRDLLSPLNDQP